MWAEYARLRGEEGWTQQRIAASKGVAASLVSERIKWHGLPEALKKHVGTAEDVRSSSKAITEDHLRAISAVVLAPELSAWLTTEAAWVELAESVVRDRAKNGAKSVAATRADAATWREFIAYAQAVHDGLPVAARVAFVADLYKRKARTLVRVKEAERAIGALRCARASGGAPQKAPPGLGTCHPPRNPRSQPP